MSRERALILGGTGAIGRATSERLLAAGSTVDVTGRDPAPDVADARGGGRSLPHRRGGVAGTRDGRCCSNLGVVPAPGG